MNDPTDSSAYFRNVHFVSRIDDESKESICGKFGTSSTEKKI